MKILNQGRLVMKKLAFRHTLFLTGDRPTTPCKHCKWGKWTGLFMREFHDLCNTVTYGY